MNSAIREFRKKFLYNLNPSITLGVVCTDHTNNFYYTNDNNNNNELTRKGLKNYKKN
jgi:hypothetical protein